MGGKVALTNVVAADQLRGLASRKAKSDEFKSVRNPLVEEELTNGWLVHKRGKTSTRLRKPKTHDRQFEDRVWTLMYRMGFGYLSDKGGAFLLVNANDPQGPDNQIDVVALDDDVAFAIECKSSEKPRKFDDFSKDLAKHAALRERFTYAVRTQFPSPCKRPSIFTIGVRTSDPAKMMRSELALPTFPCWMKRIWSITSNSQAKSGPRQDSNSLQTSWKGGLCPV